MTVNWLNGLSIFLALTPCIDSSPRNLIHDAKTLIKTHDSNNNHKIVGGHPSKIEQFPYQLSLRISDRHICGASIISKSFALTAAHCVESHNEKDQITVRAGSALRTFGGTIYTISRAHVHPRYNKTNFDFDVALLEVKGSFKFDEKSKPIKIVTSGSEFTPGTNAVVSGWGKLLNLGFLLPLRLQNAKFPLSDAKTCIENYKRVNLNITERMICAGNGEQDVCQGDSGGPLVINGIQVGIVSWGVGCAKPGYPGVYSNLAHPTIRLWIATITNGL